MVSEGAGSSSQGKNAQTNPQASDPRVFDDLQGPDESEDSLLLEASMGMPSTPKSDQGPELGNTGIIALSGTTEPNSAPIDSDTVRLLGIGGNFQTAVVQRVLDDFANAGTEKPQTMLHVQAQRDSTAAAIVEANGTTTINILKTDGAGYEQRTLGSIAGTFSLKEGSTVGCTTEDGGQETLRTALSQLSNLDVVAFSLNEKAIDPENPVVQLLASAISLRMLLSEKPLHLISTVNYTNNAEAVAKAISDAAISMELDGIPDWIEKNLYVHNSVVDRMVWRNDDGGIGTEPDPSDDVRYMPLVLETKGSVELPIPFKEHPFCRVTDNLGLWEQQKLWGANGPHTFMAALGLPMGIRSVKALLADDFVRGLVDSYVDDVVVPVLERAVKVPEPDGIPHKEFARSFVVRNEIVEMHPGFICQGMLDHKVNVRISDPIAAINKLGEVPAIDLRMLVIAYATTLRAGTPISESSKEDGVYEIPLDPSATSESESYVYVAGDDKTAPLEVHPTRGVYDLRSEISGKLLGLWGESADSIAQRLQDSGVFETLGVENSLIRSETSELLAKLLGDKGVSIPGVLEEYLAS